MNQAELVSVLSVDGQALKKIKKKEQTYEICTVAVQQNGLAIKFVSTRFIDGELCKLAIKNNWESLKYINAKNINQELCNLAFQLNINSIQYIPKVFQLDEMVKTIAKTEPMLLQYVDESFINDEICRLAFNNNHKSLIYYPIELRTKYLNQQNIYKIAELTDEYPSLLSLLEIKDETISLCLSYINLNYRLAYLFPDEVKKDLRILKRQKELNLITISQKYYDKTSDMFVIKIEVKGKSSFSKLYDLTIKVECFDEFYKLLDGDLNNANLYDYRFEGINLKGYSIKGALIKTEILIKNNLYNGEYFNRIKSNVDTLESASSKYNLIPSHNKYELMDLSLIKHDRVDDTVIAYISDIHLLHKVKNHFKDYATEEEIKRYVAKIGNSLAWSIRNWSNKFILLLAGDISSNFELNQIFYKSLKNACTDTTEIITISGNHEFLDPYFLLEENIEIQRNFFNEQGIYFLHNEVMFITLDKTYVCNYEEIINLDDELIIKVASESSLIIIGGNGFNRYNDSYNAKNVPYGKSFDILNESDRLKLEANESIKFNDLYNKIKKSCCEKRVIVLTHAPKESWNNEEHVPNWIYIHGHDHHNRLILEPDCYVYADNQIGYYNQNIQWKYFLLDQSFDCFQYYENGIHKISVDDYKKFHLAKRIQLTFNKKENDIYMLKFNDIYMFVNYCKANKNQKQNCFYLLKGGRLSSLGIKKIEELNDIYLKMGDFYNELKMVMTPYLKIQEKVADLVKQIGGSGKIHGCIVDFEKPDFHEYGFYSLSHIYINPFDLSIVPYKADNTNERKVYKSINALLELEYKDSLMQKKYLELSKNSIVIKETNNSQIGSLILDKSKELYKVSKMMKNLQITLDKKVLRFWDVNFFKTNNDNLSYLLNNNHIYDDLYETNEMLVLP